MYLVVGLGNFESKYDLTYHNMGFMVADEFAKKVGAQFNKTKCNAKIAEATLNGEKVIIAKPLTYMNLSGTSVREFVNKFKIPLSNIIVAYDDIDLEKGTLRFKKDGSAGTHNGMRNIVENLSSTNFARVRVGIGKPLHGELFDYVLSKIDNQSLELLRPQVERASNVVYDYILNKGDIQNINS